MMVDTKSNYQENAYDRIVDWYDHWYAGHWEGDEAAEAIENLFKRYWGDALKSHAIRVLDSACGTGNPFVALTRRGYQVFGSDGSKKMLCRLKANCEAGAVRLDRLIEKPLNWTDADGYIGYFGNTPLDAIVNTGNSFCHLPPNEYMQKALATFYRLLVPGGLLIIDTKKFSSDAKGILKELLFDKDSSTWIERKDRPTDVKNPGRGDTRYHTRMFYDFDPQFDPQQVQRAFIMVTRWDLDGRPETGLLSQTLPIPYYPFTAEVLAERMREVGFKTEIFEAHQGILKEWKYDVVVGRK